jgi:DNA primase
MPRLDYAALRAQIPIRRVLQQRNYVPLTIRGDQWRGVCPIHDPLTAQACDFSVNVRKDVFRCFHCGAQGNQLDLWSLLTDRPLYEASLDLCRRLGIKPPQLPPLRNPKNRPS